MAKRRHHKRRRHAVARANPRRTHRRRRTYRRNPFGISTSGIMGQVTRGAKNGLGVLVGRVGSRALPDITGISGSIASGSMGSVTATAALAGIQLAAGILVGMLAKSVAGGDFASFVVAGAFDGVYEDVGKSLGASVPVIGPYLGGYSRSLPTAAALAIRGYSSGPAARPAAAMAYGTPGRSGPAALRRIGVGAAARVAK